MSLRTANLHDLQAIADAIDSSHAASGGKGAPILVVDGDDHELVRAAYAALQVRGQGQRGGVIIMHITHEHWCTVTPDGRHCICREDYRDETDATRARAKAAVRRAKAKASRKARKRGRK